MNHLLISILLFSQLPLQKFDIKQKKLDLEDGSKLLYTLSTPPGVHRIKNLPLVIALHWGWDRSQPIPSYFGKSFLTDFILPAFKEISPVIIAPDCPSENWYNQESEDAVLTLVDYIMNNYPVDSNRVFITGYSAGGIGTWYLSSRHPELFSLAIPVACIPEEEWVKNWGTTPVFIVHGTKDELFPFEEIENVVKALKEDDVIVKFIKVENASHYDTGRFIVPLNYSTVWFKELDKD